MWFVRLFLNFIYSLNAGILIDEHFYINSYKLSCKGWNLKTWTDWRSLVDTEHEYDLKFLSWMFVFNQKKKKNFRIVEEFMKRKNLISRISFGWWSPKYIFYRSMIIVTRMSNHFSKVNYSQCRESYTIEIITDSKRLQSIATFFRIEPSIDGKIAASLHDYNLF